MASKGTRPGDPWGDIIWNVLHAQVMAEVESKMRGNNLTEKMELREETKWLLTGEEAELGETDIADASFVDDVAMIFSADSPVELNDKARAITAIVIDAWASHGIECNLKQGKTELLLIYNESGSRAAHNEAYGSEKPGLPIQTRTCGEVTVPLTLRDQRAHCRRSRATRITAQTTT